MARHPRNSWTSSGRRLKLNATEHGHVYGVPFQNSTPLLYYSVDAFKDAGLDPDNPPVTWQDWVDDLRKLARHDGSATTRWGLMFPGTYDYLGWITSGLAMSNGGEYYNPATAARSIIPSPPPSAQCG